MIDNHCIGGKQGDSAFVVGAHQIMSSRVLVNMKKKVKKWKKYRHNFMKENCRRKSRVEKEGVKKGEKFEVE